MPKMFFDKQKSDVKSHLIKFELRFIDTDNINLTICEIFEIFRADGLQRFSSFIDQNSTPADSIITGPNGKTLSGIQSSFIYSKECVAASTCNLGFN